MSTKKCRKCLRDRALDAFSPDARSRDGVLAEFQQLVRRLSKFCDGALCEIDFSKPQWA